MDKFTTLTGIAAPLPMINIDTDKIIPKQYLTTITRAGLGKGLFDELRYRPDGSEEPKFVLNREPYRQARILVTGENFGCGSSREHAPWALADFGIRCIVAPTFADIFHINCTKNGILLIRLLQGEVDRLMGDAATPANPVLRISLPEQTIDRPNGETIHFDIDASTKMRLLEGFDDISRTLRHLEQIREYEQHRKRDWPWL
jgi:3-isopropylmalate/(R)-2-methylmalate dehydratase small subunit